MKNFKCQKLFTQVTKHVFAKKGSISISHSFILDLLPNGTLQVTEEFLHDISRLSIKYIEKTNDRSEKVREFFCSRHSFLLIFAFTDY